MKKPRKKPAIVSERSMKHWSYDELKFLEENYIQLTNRQLSEKLGRTMLGVMRQLHKMELLRPQYAIDSRENEGQFKPGLVPWNKDLKGIHLSAATEFKKGNLPANTKYDGCVRKRTHRPDGFEYFYIRVGLGRWKLLHRHNWEIKHGHVPPKHIIAFKDGNTLNPNIENLMLMSRAENANRNRNTEKAAATMRKLWASGALYHDRYCLFYLAPKDRELRNELKNRPELIQLKKAQLKLQRAINEQRKG